MGYTPVQYLADAASGNSSETPLVCYAATMMSLNGMLQDENPLDFTFPIFLFQLLVILLTSRITAMILRPLRQPRYISEILGGFILGPTLMGRLPAFALTIFPFRSLLVIDSMSSIGLVFFMFIVGVEIDPDVVRRVVRRSIFVTCAALIGPVLIGILAGLMLHGRIQDGTNRGAFATFFCSILCVTSFSVLARILADLKLMASDIGRLVLSSAMIMNGVAWVLMIFSTALAQSKGKALSAIWAVVSGGLFSVAVYMAMRRAARWVQKRTPEGEEVAELHLCVILVGVMVAAFAADTIGTHAIFGAFVYGLAVPNGPLGELLIDKIGAFIEGLLLPLFFAISGFRTNLFSIVDAGAAWLLLIVVLAAMMTKVAGSMLASFYMERPFRDGISLGLLLNTKGVIELIMLNIGWDKRVLRDQTFTILVIISVVTTTMISPLVKVAAKPSRRFVAYKRRTIRWWNPESELRMLVCAHSSREVPSLISLLDISHPTKRSPFFLYSLYLVELTGRASTLFVVNTNSSASSSSTTLDSHRAAPNAGGGFIRHQTESEHISHAFESYEQHAGGVSVQSLTAFSQYSSMHEDIIALSEDKHCALILLPFHKHQTIDGTMEVTHPAIRTLNQNVLAGASCSVGILIDRSLAGTGARAQRYNVALVFIGGPDDREALAYADRLATHPGVALTVVRFLPCIGSPPPVVDVAGENDDECLAQFQAGGGGEAEYVERMVGNAEETVAMLREMEGRYDLYIVGIGKGMSSPFTAGLKDWSECEELGPIGDLLASPDFGSRSSVLVLQSGKYGEESGEDINGGTVAVSMTANPGR
ncbi:cation/H(+) antiporter 15-like [Phalaenopsis equestris]|uniref:cation/H(+) antiporter 15-like n=1 Tax=Phalaenopsis equestris TaxID=78828 RepID=UPI0009E6033D|nr:cation/H(+) antiporter 15-like [Phalaenopsis equestris]